MSGLEEKGTVKAEAVTRVDFGIKTEHAGDIRVFDEPSVEDLLSQIVEFVAIDSSLDSDSVVSLFPDDSVKHFGEPPDTWVKFSEYHSCGRSSSLRIRKATFLSF